MVTLYLKAPPPMNTGINFRDMVTLRTASYTHQITIDLHISENASAFKGALTKSGFSQRSNPRM
jgi:hypothetical protein